MKGRKHPALLGPSHLTHSTFYDEIHAAHFWGLDVETWFLKSYEARALMAAYSIIAPVVENLSSWDRQKFIQDNPEMFGRRR